MRYINKEEINELTKKDRELKKLLKQKNKLRERRKLKSFTHRVMAKISLPDLIKMEKKALKQDITVSEFIRELIVKELKGGIKCQKKQKIVM